MMRALAIAALFLASPARAEDTATPVTTTTTATPATEALTDVRRALVERATAPATAARLPLLGTDPLRHGQRLVKPGGLDPTALVPQALPGRMADRARAAADRAADRAASGRGPAADRERNGRGRERRGEGHGPHDHEGPPRGP